MVYIQVVCCVTLTGGGDSHSPDCVGVDADVDDSVTPPAQRASCGQVEGSRS